MAIMDTENSSEVPDSIEKDNTTENVLATETTENVPAKKTKKKKTKSPTPIKTVENTLTAEVSGGRAGSMTPGPRSSRSHTPFSLYLQRRSEDPTVSVKVRSITPFLDRKDKEKTPFELGKDLKSQLIAHKMVFDRASVMDVSEDRDYEPVRYLTSDVAVVDRASIMDVSNVEVVYLIEEYDDAEYQEQLAAQLAEEKAEKKKAKRTPRKSKSVTIALSEKEDSPSVERESPKTKTKTIKKKVIKKKEEEDEEEEERTPPPIQLPKLKLDLGGGPKFNKKLFEQKPPSIGPEGKPPPKRAKGFGAPMEEPKTASTTENKKSDNKSESREGSEFVSDRELSQNPDDEEIPEEEEKEPTPEPEPEPELTEEELAMIEAERLAAEEIERQRRRWERKEKERIDILKKQMAEVERWNRIREEEGIPFMNRIKKFFAQKRDDPGHPCFVNHLPNVTAMEGKNVRISGSVNGTDLQIKWYKNGREIHASEKYIMKINLYDIISLEIMNCLKVDTGEYMCVISSDKSKATSTCFVSVVETSEWMDEPCPPNIDVVEDSYHFADDELVIECRVHGTPRPIVSWYRHYTELKTDQTYRIVEKSHGVHALVIKNPNPQDTGIYVIKANNTSGEHVRKHIVEFFVNTKKVVY